MATSEQKVGQDRKVMDIVRKYDGKPEHLLSILHEVQDGKNHLTEDDLVQVARGLGIPVSKVYGVATFYSLFSTKPRGRYIIRVCENAPCHVTGAPEVISALEKELGIKMGETTEDGLFTLEYTSCLGLCGVAPVVMINDQVFGNLTPEKVKPMLDQFRPKGGESR